MQKSSDLIPQDGANHQAVARETAMKTRTLAHAMLFFALATLSGCNSKPHEFDTVDALVLCKEALTNVARDPGSVDIPNVPDFGSKGEYYFAWGASTKRIHMRNGLGLPVAVTASCIVNHTQKRIISLTLNGETLI